MASPRLASSRLRAAVAASLLVPIACAVVAWPQPALAQQHDPYKQHMENGIKLFQDKNYAAALSEFRAAYDAHPKANPLVNMALCYKAQFNYPKAIQILEKALKEHADSMDAGDKKAAEDAIKEMRGLLAYVNVKVTPNAAVVTVDGDDAAPGNAATQVPLPPGTHKVGAHLDGFETQEVDVTVSSGQKDKVVTITLVANKGWVAVQYPGMLIGLDGKFLARDSFSGMVAPGQHVLQIYTAGRPGYPVTIQVIAGQSVWVRPGPRGVPVVSGPPPVLPNVQPPNSPPIKKGEKVEVAPPPTQPPVPEVPVEQKRGFYVIGGAGLIWPLTHATAGANHADYSTNGGWSGQLVGGYRVNNAAGFQLYFNYFNVFTPLKTIDTHIVKKDSNDGYTDQAVQLGAGLRLMTSGKTFRLVGGGNGGIAIDTLHFTGVDDAQSGTNGQAFLLGNIGLELDVTNVLLGVVLEGGVQTARGLDSKNAGTFDGSLGLFGVGLRVGYAFWK